MPTPIFFVNCPHLFLFLAITLSKASSDPAGNQRMLIRVVIRLLKTGRICGRKGGEM